MRYELKTVSENIVFLLVYTSFYKLNCFSEIKFNFWMCFEKLKYNKLLNSWIKMSINNEPKNLNDIG